LPTAVFALNGNRHKYILGTGLYSYLFARYSGISYVWYVGNLIWQRPNSSPYWRGLLLGWTLFSVGGQGVPDGARLLMLLGVAIGVLGMARRFLKIWQPKEFPNTRVAVRF